MAAPSKRRLPKAQKGQVWVTRGDYPRNDWAKGQARLIDTAMVPTLEEHGWLFGACSTCSAIVGCPCYHAATALDWNAMVAWIDHHTAVQVVWHYE